MRNYRAALMLVIAAGLLAAAYVGGLRVATEQANRTVEVGVEWREVDQLALMTGRHMADVLSRLKAAGATTVVVQEDTIGSLQQDGRISLKALAVPSSGETRWATRIEVAPGGGVLAARIGASLRQRLGLRERRSLDTIVPARGSNILAYGVGLDPDKLADAVRAGFRIAVRPTAEGVASRRGIELLLEQMQAPAATHVRGTSPARRIVIFSGNAVAGHPDHVQEVADWLRAHESLPDGLYYGSVEFGKQLGDAALSRMLRGRVVRVHAITAPEMQTVAPPVAVERFVRAVRERNIRFCYVRLFLTGTADPLGKNERYLRALTSRLRGAGFQPGAARPFDHFEPPRVAILLAGVATVAGALLLLVALVPVSGRTLLIFGLLGASASAVAQWVAPCLARKALALLAAIVFPTLAMATFPPDKVRRPTTGGALLPALGRFVACGAISLVGAALIVGLLSATPFMTKADQFSGVKLALFMPLVLVAAIHLGGLWGREPNARAQWRAAVRNWHDAMAQVVKYGHVVVLFVVFAAAAVVLLRSGNEPGFGLSGAEMKFREALERLLWVRPRQKEFLVGHPLLLLSLFMILRGRARGMWAALAAATLGQTSMVNTFCHIHTPLAMSALRTLNGLWVGALIGLIAIAVYRLAWERRLSDDESAPAGPSDDSSHDAC